MGRLPECPWGGWGVLLGAEEEEGQTNEVIKSEADEEREGPGAFFVITL